MNSPPPHAQITSPYTFGFGLLYNNAKMARVALCPGRSTIGRTRNDTNIGVLDPRQNEFDVTRNLVMSRRGKLCGGAKLWTSLKLASPSVYTEMSGVFVIKRIRSLCIL